MVNSWEMISFNNNPPTCTQTKCFCVKLIDTIVSKYEIVDIWKKCWNKIDKFFDIFFGISDKSNEFPIHSVPFKSIARELIVVNEQFEIEICFVIVSALNTRDGNGDWNVVFLNVNWSILSFLNACVSIEAISVFSIEIRKIDQHCEFIAYALNFSMRHLSKATISTQPSIAYESSWWMFTY